jgi:hypothetical protein
MEEQLHADAHEQHAERELEVLELRHHAGEHEVERTQAHDREDVRRDDDERLLRDREDRRDRVEREHDVLQLDRDQAQREDRQDVSAVDLHHEVTFVVFFDANDPAQLANEPG